MDFFAYVDRAQELVRRHGRVSGRGLARELEVDEAILGEIVEELVVRGVVAWDGSALNWTPGSGPASGDTEVIIGTSRGEGTDGTTEGVPALGTEAEIRHLTVMFSDVVGSTELSGVVGFETWTEAMRGVHELARQSIEAWEGYIGSYLGDGVLAFFGYPVAQEDAAERAVRAGLAMVAALPDLNERLRSSVGRDLTIRIGIHTGPVVVDRFGGAVHAMGQTTNIAARVEAAAPPDSVVMSPATRRLVSGVFVTEDLGRHEMKGVAEPLPLTRVLRVGGVRPRLGAGRSDRSELVGRAPEIALLHDRWNRVVGGEGQVIEIVAEAGLGKSRLVDTFRATLTDSPHSWLDVTCSPYAKSATLQPIAELQRRGVGLSPDDPDDVKRAALSTALSAVGLDADAGIELLAELHGFAGLDRPPSAQQRVALFDLLIDWLVALSRLQPLVFACDDLHWADPTTLELIGRLVECTASEPLLLITTTRPDGVAGWGRRSNLTSLHLNRLTPQQSAQVAVAAAGRPLDAELVQSIVRRADGVPLFVEELAATVGRDRLVEIPDSLHNLLMARLERLGGLREVAQVASVIGREFRLDELVLLSGRGVAELDPLLEVGVQQELFFRRVTSAGVELFFKHALMRDAVYESMLAKTRQRLHGRFAHLLIDARPAVCADRPDLVAEHLTLGGDAAATDWWERAAEQAVRRGAAAEAEQFYRRALDAATALDIERSIRLQSGLVGSINATRGHGNADVVPILDELVRLTEQPGFEWQRAMAIAGLAGRHCSAGQFAEALAAAERARRIGEQIGATDIVLGAILLEMTVLNFSGFPLRCVAMGEQVERDELRSSSRYADANGIATEPLLLAWRAYSLALLGRFDESDAVHRLASAHPATEMHPATQTSLLTLRSTTALLRGNYARYATISDEFLASARRNGMRYLESMGEMTTATAAATLDPGEENLGRLHALVEQVAGTGNLLGGPIFLWLVAGAEIACGQPGRAIETLDLARAVADLTDQHWYDPQIVARRLSAQHSIGVLGDDWIDEIDAASAFARERSLVVGALHLAITGFELARGTAHQAAAATRLTEAIADIPQPADSPTVDHARDLLATVAPLRAPSGEARSVEPVEAFEQVREHVAAGGAPDPQVHVRVAVEDVPSVEVGSVVSHEPVERPRRRLGEEHVVAVADEEVDRQP